MHLTRTLSLCALLVALCAAQAYVNEPLPVGGLAPEPTAAPTSAPIASLPVHPTPRLPIAPEETGVAQPTTAVTEEFHRPNFEKIAADCSSDFTTYCPEGGERRRGHHGHHFRHHDHHHSRRLHHWRSESGDHHPHHGHGHHGHHGHHGKCEGKFRCIGRMRENWATLQSTCKATLTQELPCMTDAVTHCASAEGHHEVIECLFNTENSLLSTRCSAFLAWKAQKYTEEQQEYNQPGNGEYEEQVEDADEEESMFEDHRMFTSKKARRHCMFMIFLIALFAALIGSCCTRCCMRRRCRRQQGHWNRGGQLRPCCAHALAQVQAQNAIPLQQIPHGRATDYAVFSDDVAHGSPVV